MKDVKLDFSKLKHVKSDKNSTTLQHKDGHSITLAHSALSPATRTQLETLASADPETKEIMMAEGGEVEEQEQSADVSMPVEPSAPAPVIPYEKMTPEQRDEFAGRMKAKAALIGDKEMPPMPAPFGAGEAPQAASQASLAPEQPQEQPQMADPLADVAPEQPAPQDGLNTSMAGLQQEANAKTQLAKDAEEQRTKQIDVLANAKADYEKSIAELNGEREALIADIQASHVDPEKYWTGDKDGNGSHSKIMSAIGMIMAGFNPTNSPNAAINFIQHQMEQNLKAQQMNLDSKNNLLKMNLAQFGNLKEAQEATRVMQNDMMANQLELAAAKAAQPMAKAQLLQAAGKLKMEANAKTQQLAQTKTISNLIQTARQKPEMADQVLNALEGVDPKRASELRQLHVPGMGFASSNEGAKVSREMASMVNTAKGDIQVLKDMIKKGGKSLNPQTIAKADTIRRGLIGKLRVPITGPGAMSEGEREMLEKMIPDITSVMSLDSSNKTRLDTLSQRLDASLSNTLSANGLTVPKELKVPEKRPEIREGDVVTAPNGVQYKRVGNKMVKVK